MFFLALNKNNGKREKIGKRVSEKMEEREREILFRNQVTLYYRVSLNLNLTDNPRKPCINPSLQQLLLFDKCKEGWDERNK